jgi:hypothetical protein
MNTGNVMADRRSVEGLNATQEEYPVFLNDPVDLCMTAEPGDVQLLGVSRCDAESYCIKYIASKEGQIDLLLDFDGPDDVYTPGTSDVMIAIDVPAADVGKPSCVEWDGLDGLGNMLDENAGTAIPVVISYAQGIYHFPIYDAEFMTNGFVIEAVRPFGPQPLLYYDDSQISIASGSGEPSVQLSGCMTPCHRWTVFNDPNIPGFGNLNTINSWWFSQRIIRAEVFFLPAYLQCSIVGPESICEGESATLTWEPGIEPAGSDMPEVLSVLWAGPDIIGSNEGSEILVGDAGSYNATVTWLTQLEDTCVATCEYLISLKPITYGEIDTLIISGEVVDINGPMYSEGGLYVQTLTGSNGCDSILTIRVSLLQTAVLFTLDECNSFPSIGTDSIYTEFTPEYPEPISCAEIEASIAYRDNPGVNRHSCTPGIEDSPAICISSHEGCEYSAPNEKAFVFEVTVTPAPDTVVAVTGLSFYERAPEMYDWISGPTGPNNYPTKYGVRILKDGVEIYRDVDIDATTDWTLEEFNFLGLEEFVVGEESVFRFELLGYCLIGNGEPVAAWDLDEIRVEVSCGLEPPEKGDISGSVISDKGYSIRDVEILLSVEPNFIDPIITMSDAEGVFMFPGNLAGESYYLRAQKYTDYLENVSTLDLVALQKHLLGLREFDSPLQYLAADANGSESVSVLDLVDLRKLVLGQYTELPHNASWLLGKPDQELTLADPWSFERTMVVQDLTTELAQVDFFGIKIGDIHRRVSGVNGNIDVRSSSILKLNVPTSEVRAGEQVRLDVTVQDAADLAGLQMALKLNDAEFLDITSGVLSMESCFAYDAEMEILRISWSNAISQKLQAGTVLFSVIVRTRTDASANTLLDLAADDLTAEAYLGEALEVVDLQLGFESHRATAFSVSASPNPFTNETTLRFVLAEAGPVQVTVMDITGKVLYDVNQACAAGVSDLTLHSNVLGSTSNILMCRVQTDQQVQTLKLLQQ